MANLRKQKREKMVTAKNSTFKSLPVERSMYSKPVEMYDLTQKWCSLTLLGLQSTTDKATLLQDGVF